VNERLVSNNGGLRWVILFLVQSDQPKPRHTLFPTQIDLAESSYALDEVLARPQIE
jgi:hypothetical protein